MQLYFQSICSSSSGNCLALWSEKTRILVDCGFSSMKKTRQTLSCLFGNPAQVDIIRPLPTEGHCFAEDVNMGIEMEKLMNAQGTEKAMMQVEVSAGQDGITHQFDMKAKKFLALMNDATETVEQYRQKYVNAH